MPVMLVIGGLGLFLFGLSYLASNVESMAGATLNRLLRLAGRSPFSALASGVLVATLVQSGAAISLMTGSFMDAGLLGFREALMLALGSMLGATVTVQLASAGILSIGVPLIGVGFFVSLLPRRTARHLGGAIVGLGLVFLGLRTLVAAVAPAAGSNLFRDLLQAASGAPLILAAAGAVFAALVHSSNAPAALAIGLLAAGALTPAAAIALIAGAGVGTPLVVWLESGGRGVEARRVAATHVALKAVVACIVAVASGWLAAGVWPLQPDSARFAANVHTVFSLLVALVALPFLRPLATLARRAIPDPVERGPRPKYLSEGVQDPRLVLVLAHREVARISDHVLTMLASATAALGRDGQAADRARYEEEVVDILVHQVVVYVARRNPPAEPAVVQALTRIASALESMGDLIKRLLRQEEKLIALGLDFSPQGRDELHRAAQSVLERATRVFNLFAVSDVAGCLEAASGNEVSVVLSESRAAHLLRLGRMEPGAELTSAVHLDSVTILEQVNGELSIIARTAPQALAALDEAQPAL